MATPNIVPRANGEGSIGTSLKKWAKGYLNALSINNVEILPDTIPTASSIPIADANGKIDSEWIKDASETVAGVVELATPTLSSVIVSITGTGQELLHAFNF